jgi:hypothetical protein
MIALFSTLLGFLTSGIPELIKIYNAKQDRAHELAVMKLQMEQQAQGHSERMAEIDANADISESEALIKASSAIVTGVGWADALINIYNSSVRPTVTYLFVIFYGAVKVATYVILTNTAGKDTAQAILLLWTVEDMAVFCTVIGYWFGSRSLARSMGYTRGRAEQGKALTSIP